MIGGGDNLMMIVVVMFSDDDDMTQSILQVKSALAYQPTATCPT